MASPVVRPSGESSTFVLPEHSDMGEQVDEGYIDYSETEPDMSAIPQPDLTVDQIGIIPDQFQRELPDESADSHLANLDPNPSATDVDAVVDLDSAFANEDVAHATVPCENDLADETFQDSTLQWDGDEDTTGPTETAAAVAFAFGDSTKADSTIGVDANASDMFEDSINANAGLDDVSEAAEPKPNDFSNKEQPHEHNSLADSGEDPNYHEINYEQDEETMVPEGEAVNHVETGEDNQGLSLDDQAQGYDNVDTTQQDASAAVEGEKTGEENSFNAHENHDLHDATLDETALDEALAADSPDLSLTTPGEVDAELPEILVTWHGVEYPLFYDAPGSEGKQCFFEDVNLLQCAMGELLASFRRELADDVADCDELVLQVNEMGLEFAESAHPDQFLDITLGSVLQVFNDLVKNKQPDASRPLYAYLITRPNCSKRWQVLIEDAYQGKNIDEVSILFPGPQGYGDMQRKTTDEGDDGMDMEHDGSADDYSEHHSAAEDGQHNQDVDYFGDVQGGEDDHDSPSNNYGQVVDDGEDSLSTQTLEQQQPVTSHASVDAIERDETESYEVIDALVPGNDDFHAVVGGTEEDFVQDDDDNGDAEQPYMNHDDEAHTQVAASNVVIDATSTDATPAFGESIGAALNPGEEDEEGEETHHEHITADTSASATMGDTYGDFNADIDLTADINDVVESSTFDNETQPDGLDEIDWREFPGEGDEGVAKEATVEDSALTSVKRPRSDEDDGLDAGDEQDFKRRRSDAEA